MQSESYININTTKTTRWASILWKGASRILVSWEPYKIPIDRRRHCPMVGECPTIIVLSKNHAVDIHMVEAKLPPWLLGTLIRSSSMGGKALPHGGWMSYILVLSSIPPGLITLKVNDHCDCKLNPLSFCTHYPIIIRVQTVLQNRHFFLKKLSSCECCQYVYAY